MINRIWTTLVPFKKKSHKLFEKFRLITAATQHCPEFIDTHCKKPSFSKHSFGLIIVCLVQALVSGQMPSFNQLVQGRVHGPVSIGYGQLIIPGEMGLNKTLPVPLCAHTEDTLSSGVFRASAVAGSSAGNVTHHNCGCARRPQSLSRKYTRLVENILQRTTPSTVRCQ